MEILRQIANGGLGASGLGITAQPADPVEGACVIWQSNGTGYGDDGDLCIITQAGGVLYTNTIVNVVP